MIKTKVAFLRAGFYPAKQSNLKSIQKARIGWKKAGSPKSHFCFDHVNKLIVISKKGCNTCKINQINN